jgi:hypothetical protein
MGDLRQRVSQELLPFVKTPGQYVGGEFNQLPKPGDWAQADVRVVVAFPDTYAIGMSHLGCQIIYWLCNQTPGVTAERVFCPWTDAEQVMRAKNIPLFTLDTRQPAAEADIFAVSLQYEMAYSNILTLLDLADIPLRSAERDERHPLVVAGGPQADSPRTDGRIPRSDRAGRWRGFHAGDSRSLSRVPRCRSRPARHDPADGRPIPVGVRAFAL